MHNQVPSDPFQQPAVPDATPLPYAPPQFGPAGPHPHAGGELPYGAPPAYGQFPGHQPAAPIPPGTNGFAIAALVTSICGGIGIGTLLGLAFGVTALVQLKRRPQKGRGLAISALAISCLTLVAAVVGLAVVIRNDMRDKAAGIETVDAAKLKRGDCIRSVKDSATVYDMPVTPCDQPHEAEVYHLFTLPSGPYPGQATVEKEAEEKCVAAFEPYSTPQTEDMEVFFLYPLSGDWWRDRGVTCIAIDPTGRRTTSIVG